MLHRRRNKDKYWMQCNKNHFWQRWWNIEKLAITHLSSSLLHHRFLKSQTKANIFQYHCFLSLCLSGRLCLPHLGLLPIKKMWKMGDFGCLFTSAGGWMAQILIQTSPPTLNELPIHPSFPKFWWKRCLPDPTCPRVRNIALSPAIEDRNVRIEGLKPVDERETWPPRTRVHQDEGFHAPNAKTN